MLTRSKMRALLRATRERMREAQRLADESKPRRYHDARTGVAYLVSPDLEHATHWRVTTFGADRQPIGHI